MRTWPDYPGRDAPGNACFRFTLPANVNSIRIKLFLETVFNLSHQETVTFFQAESSLATIKKLADTLEVPATDFCNKSGHHTLGTYSTNNKKA